MDSPDPGPAKRRLLNELKRGGATTASELADRLDLTDVAIRQHLQGLEGQGLVRSRPRLPAGRGRPAVAWELTPAGHTLFPERHAELTVDLIEATRTALGATALDRVLEVRAQKQIEDYRKRLPPPSASLKKRVEALAGIRSEEGYMAEVIIEKPGCYLLVEHHCPICEAARTCVGLCRMELEVFQEVLGPGVQVERIQHLLTDGERCVYRVAS